MQAMALVATMTMRMTGWEAVTTAAVSLYLVYSNCDDTLRASSLGFKSASLKVL